MQGLWRQLAIATNWPVLLAVGVLSSLGIVSIWSDRPSDAQRQLVFLAVSFGVLLLLQTIGYLRIGRWAWGFYLLSLLLVIYTIIPGAPRVPVVNGARAWIDFGLMRFQPAEVTKIAFVLVLARYLRFRSNYRTLGGLLPPFALALLPVGLILQQPDLGTALTFIPALFAMLFVAGARMKHLLAIVGMAVAMVPVAWLSGTCSLHGGSCSICPSVPLMRHLPQLVKHYQRQRVIAMVSRDPRVLQEAGFQQERALTAIGSGGLLGKGLGEVPVGRQVPEAHNDMIFALIAEQWGFLGSAILLGAYVVLLVAGVEIAAGTREPMGRLIALGIVALLGGQMLLNLAVVLRLMPVTGVTLPFVSYGGSSLLASYIAVGLLLNVGQNRPLIIARESFQFD